MYFYSTLLQTKLKPFKLPAQHDNYEIADIKAPSNILQSRQGYCEPHQYNFLTYTLLLEASTIANWDDQIINYLNKFRQKFMLKLSGYSHRQS